MSKDCNFKTVSADQNANDCIRDAFINGLQSTHIRQRLLEEKELDLPTAFEKARALETAQKQCDSYSRPSASVNAAMADAPETSTGYGPSKETSGQSTSAAMVQKCFFCGGVRHPRFKCPAKDATCKNCSKTGHWVKVCRSSSQSTAAALPTLAATHSDIPGQSSDSLDSPPQSSQTPGTTAAAPGGLSRAVVKVQVNGKPLTGLIDTGSSTEFHQCRRSVSAQMAHRPSQWVCGYGLHFTKDGGPRALCCPDQG